MTLKLEFVTGVDGKEWNNNTMKEQQVEMGAAEAVGGMVFKEVKGSVFGVNEKKLGEQYLGIIVPKLTFEIVGKPGVSADFDVNTPRETKYVTGTIIGKGIPAEEIGLQVTIHDEPKFLSSEKTEVITLHKVGVITPERLDQLIRKSDLLKEFAKALKEIRAKEKATNGDYPIVWNLQK
jgi:hypothetical protein